MTRAARYENRTTAIIPVEALPFIAKYLFKPTWIPPKPENGEIKILLISPDNTRQIVEAWNWRN